MAKKKKAKDKPEREEPVKKKPDPAAQKLRLIKAAISLACGALLFLSCADFDIWPLTWVALVPMFWVTLDERTRKPAYYGFLCGLVANGGGFYWIVGFLQRFGHLPFVVAVPIWLLLVSYQAITFTVFFWLTRKLRDHLKLGVTFIAPVVYVACELIVPYVFPWYLAITQAWVRPVIQIADLTGPLGVSFLLVLVNGALFEAWQVWRAERRLPRRRLAIAFGLVAACLAYGQVRIHQVEAARAAAPKLQVGVVQANIGIHEKWRPQLAAEQLSVHQRLAGEMERKGAELIVWPESSYPYMFRRDQAHDWNDDRAAQRGFHAPLLFGSLTMGGGARYPYNSALLLDGGGNVRGLFDKNILMVFGEYIPFYEQMKWIKEYIPETSNWARGTDVAVFPLETPKSGTVKIGPMICYEDIFPSFGRRLTKKDPNLLVNITNDAWFGRTSEPYEHLALSVYRAVESRLDLVRAVNTGVSAFIDSTGKVFASSPSVDPDEQKDAKPVGLMGEIAVQKAFTFYATMGEWFGGLCLLILVILGVRALDAAGRPVRWTLVGTGAGVLLATLLVGVTLLSGPSKLGLAIDLLTHRNLPAGSADAAFSVGVRMFLIAAIGCAGLGAFLAWRQRASAPLEATLAVIAVLVVPATVFGTLEGEQAGLVMGALAGIGFALLAGRMTARRLTRPETDT
jgi:apolipoprotein N-acyltransferase